MVGSRLCTIDEVRTVARLTENSDIVDGDIASSIEDATYFIRSEYGDPNKKSYFYFQSNSGSESYDFTGNNEPVHSIDSLDVDGAVMPTGSYTGSLDTGFVGFDLSFIADWDGHKVDVVWVPRVTNLLAKHMAALDLIDSSMIINGKDIQNPLSSKLKMKVDMYKEELRPKGVYSAKEFVGYDERKGKFIQQDWY